MKSFFLIILFFFITNLYSQEIKTDSLSSFKNDSLKFSSKRDTVIKIPFGLNVIKNPFRLSNSSDSTLLSEWIWNDKRNVPEILGEKNGFFSHYTGTGGHNFSVYNGYSEYNIGIFRDGIQVNDIFSGGYESENFSVNEIERIEEVSNVSSFLYGINTQGKAINIITKDVFRPRLFSQLRYSQDRDGALYADFYSTIPISNKINFTFGINNHSSDGRYDNTDFSNWRGRFKVNFFLSPKVNIKLNFNYTKILRGLNEGLINSTNDTLINPTLANSMNTDSYEKIYNYTADATMILKLLKDNSLTRLRVYTINTLRAYRDEENRNNSNSIYLSNDFHYITYGAELKQDFEKNVSGVFLAHLQTGANVYANLYNFQYLAADWYDTTGYYQSSKFNYINKNFYSGFFKLDLSNKFINLSGFAKYELADGVSGLNYGVEGKLNLINKEEIKISLTGGANSTRYGINYQNLYSPVYSNIPYYNNDRRRYFEAGIELTYKNIFIKAVQFDNNFSDAVNFSNGEYSIKYNSKYFDAVVNMSLLPKRLEYLPLVYVKSDFVYHDYFFKNKLNLHTGFNIKISSDFYPQNYSQYLYMNKQGAIIGQNNIFDVDFYIGARIGTANINFTLANLLNKLNLTKSIYPFDNRGGFVNSISKFTIVWDFNG